ncbi:MAG: hypothetical protein HRU12_19845, partial [Phaeodactylibacter sp.]|nr:hypothetical protein [Phaeodactylibacter sp.]
KLQLETKHFEKHSFRTMEETDKSQIPRLAINMTAKFAEEPSGKVRFDLLTAEFDMRVEQPRRSYDFNSQSRLVFYDYDSPFSMPLFDAPKTISDYQQIQYTPYRTALWEKDQFIAPSENAKAFIDQLETRKLFINAAPNVRIKYVDYRYDYYRPGWEIDTELTCNMPCVPAPPLAEEDVLNLTSADPYDSIYVKTQLYLDYDLEGDSLQFFTAAMIDYQFSYIVAPSPVKTKLAAGYLKLADYYAQQLKNELSTCCSSFSRSKNFQVQEKLDEYNKKLDKAINEYHSGVNKRNKTKALKNWTEKLEALEGKE